LAEASRPPSPPPAHGRHSRPSPRSSRSQSREIRNEGGEATALVADVLDESQLAAARDQLIERWGRIDILVNAAGGNVARARNDSSSVFDVPLDAHEEALQLNLHGTVTPSLVFGAAMAIQRSGSIINISSMAALRVLSGVMAYSIAKAGVDNFTRWLAVEMAGKHGDGIRVNAIAPASFSQLRTERCS
jgi:NAD(P)-dependent dehydrogenase (short-subunit alcohol dehydrogenase family)